MISQNPETYNDVVPQRPDLNVETVEQATHVVVSNQELPWITNSTLEIPTVEVTTTNGLKFRYGSAVKANGTLEHIAGQVTEHDSRAAEEVMFKSLPIIFDRMLPPNIDRVSSVESAWSVFKAVKKGPDAPRLFFTWFNDNEGQPVVLKLAITKHKKQEETYAILQGRGNHRKKDGRSR